MENFFSWIFNQLNSKSLLNKAIKYNTYRTTYWIPIRKSTHPQCMFLITKENNEAIGKLNAFQWPRELTQL